MVDGGKSKGGDPLITEDQVGEGDCSRQGGPTLIERNATRLRETLEDLMLEIRCVRKGCQNYFPDTGLYC